MEFGLTNFPPSELILNNDGSVYHLNLLPEDIADTIITVGDPDRVGKVSRYFDSIELKKHKREFEIHTGRIGNKRITVMSTGMGTSNIEIVMHELDALVNIDLPSRTPKKEHTSLSIIRIGTSGSMSNDVPLDAMLITENTIGFDGIMNYYTGKNEDPFEERICSELNELINQSGMLPRPYFSKSSKQLISALNRDSFILGNTATCIGFYAPQGRLLRLSGMDSSYFEKLAGFVSGDFRLHNFEMETAAILEFARRFGHKATSTNAIVANRLDNTFSSDPYKTVDMMIQKVLDRLST